MKIQNDILTFTGACFNCGKQGHLSRDCTEQKSERSERPGGFRDRCYNCNKIGHRAFECRNERPQRRDRDDERCYNCNEVGHRAYECTNERSEEDPQCYRYTWREIFF